MWPRGVSKVVWQHAGAQSRGREWEAGGRSWSKAQRTPASLQTGPESGSPGFPGQAHHLAANLRPASVSPSISPDCGLEKKTPSGKRGISLIRHGHGGVRRHGKTFHVFQTPY